MDKNEHEKNTLAYYDHHAREFNSFRGEGVSHYWSKELALFQKLLPDGTVLEVGCGIGNEALLLREMGYGYVGTDISLGMLSIAKSRYPEGNFACQDLRVPGLSPKFDGLLAIASLLHLDKAEIVSSLAVLRDQLRQGGIGLITLKEGVGTEVDNKGRFYSYYSVEEMAKCLVEAGFNLLDITLHEEKDHPFICCFIKNP